MHVRPLWNVTSTFFVASIRAALRGMYQYQKSRHDYNQSLEVLI